MSNMVGCVSSELIGSMLTKGFKQMLFIDRYRDYDEDVMFFTHVYVTVHFKEDDAGMIGQQIQPYYFESLFDGAHFLRTTVESE